MRLGHFGFQHNSLILSLISNDVNFCKEQYLRLSIQNTLVCQKKIIDILTGVIIQLNGFAGIEPSSQEAT